MVNFLDYLTRSLVVSRYFTEGWGSPAALRSLFQWRDRFSTPGQCYKLVANNYPIHIDKEQIHVDCRIIDGHFISPFSKIMPGILPEESRIARFQAVLPMDWSNKSPMDPQVTDRPVVVHLAGTGDHFFWRRRTLLARPLIKEAGIGSIILENPFYGCRKPKEQLRSNLRNVTDLFVMGGALMLESLALLHWCERSGFGPLGITGISMGGHMASLAATAWPKPLALAPCLSWSTASTAFTEGVMSASIPWKLLRQQYNDQNSIYGDEFLKSLKCSETLLKQKEAFLAGVNFAQTFKPSQEGGDYDSNDCQPQAEKGVDGVGGEHNNSKHVDQKAYSAANKSLHSLYELVAGAVNKTLKETLNVKDIAGLNQSGEQKMALHFMAGVMDEFTHLSNFPTPCDTSCTIIVAAKSDSYIPRDSIDNLQELWQGAELRVVDSGHVGAFVFKQAVFRKAIIDSVERLKQKQRDIKIQQNIKQ